MSKRRRPPRSWKTSLRNGLKRARHRAVSSFFSFDERDLASALQRVGLRAGDVVLVHVSYDRFEGFRGTPLHVIQVLQRIVGPTGTLLMPTLPFTGRAVDYARRGEVTDLAYSPSATGLVTEIFRRMPDVVRSVHPTHSVAAWGAHAVELIQGHHLAATPCGKESPFLKLLDVDGKVLFLGASIRAMTFYHGLEELQEAELPVSPFTSEVFELQTRDNDGKLWTTRTRLYSADRRDTTLLVPVLKDLGAWHEDRVGLLRLAAVRCRDILRASGELTRAGRSIYPGT